MVMIKPVILCGGVGTRLWPISNARTPKQFLALSGPRSMLAETEARTANSARFRHVLAIGSAQHRRLLEETLPHADILLEPVGRNSAPPIAAACLKSDPDELLLIMPADHYIEDLAAFHAAIEAGIKPAQAGSIVTFGIEPDHPATGYGYIQSSGSGEVRRVERFVEKPNQAVAQHYLDEGGFYWNAGIFLFRAGVMLDAFKAHAPDILEAVNASLIEGQLDRLAFASVRAESIDYAVLEHASNIAVVPVSMGWSDLGDFRALHAIEAKRKGSDCIITGPGATSGSGSIYIHAEIGPVAVHGLDDVAVIACNDGILVTRISDAAGVKAAGEAAQNAAAQFASSQQRADLGGWLWENVLPAWARLAIDPESGGFIEQLGTDGAPLAKSARRGRIAPRQLFTFARAKRLGWNSQGAADEIIEAALAFLDGPARSPDGGWAHRFSGNGTIEDARRDLYDHAFIALAASEVAALGDRRGDALANEAFTAIDRLFLDPENGGWHDPETAPRQKRANPHMHLLEASLLHYEATYDEASFKRIGKIAALFERWMFDPETGAVQEVFQADWRPVTAPRIEPGHCYEWAYLLGEVRRLTARDTLSWSRRLIDFAEGKGLVNGFAADVAGHSDSFRLWPQLERLRALTAFPRLDIDCAKILDEVDRRYMKKGALHVWTDRLGGDLQPIIQPVPASMLYHFMTALAPIAAAPDGS